MYSNKTNNIIKVTNKCNLLFCLLLFLPNLILAKGPFEDNYLVARDKAISSGKACLIYFTEEGNKGAVWMEQKVFSTPEVSTLLNQNYVSARMNIQNFDASILMNRLTVTKAPAIGILDAAGKVIASVNRGMTSDEMTAFLTFYSKPENAGKPLALSGSTWETQVAAWGDYVAPVPVQATTPVAVVAGNEPSLPKVAPTSVNKEEKEKPMVSSSFDSPKPDEKVSAPRPADPKVVALSGTFIVQTGVFSTSENATQQLQKLKALGCDNAYSEMVVVNQKTLYKVISGKYNTESDAQAIIGKLESAGIKGIVKKM